MTSLFIAAGATGELQLYDFYLSGPPQRLTIPGSDLQGVAIQQGTRGWGQGGASEIGESDSVFVLDAKQLRIHRVSRDLSEMRGWARLPLPGGGKEPSGLHLSAPGEFFVCFRDVPNVAVFRFAE